MSELFNALGVDLDDLEWQDLSVCKGMDTNNFYDDYESSAELAKVIDEACLSCPVMTQCLQQGMDGGETGVWGGIYLSLGKPDEARNAHKTQAVWNRIKERIVDTSK